MTGKIREAFLKFSKNKGHARAFIAAAGGRPDVVVYQRRNESV